MACLGDMDGDDWMLVLLLLMNSGCSCYRLLTSTRISPARGDPIVVVSGKILVYRQGAGVQAEVSIGCIWHGCSHECRRQGWKGKQF